MQVIDGLARGLAQTLIMGVQRVARAVRAALKPDAILVTQFNAFAGACGSRRSAEAPPLR
ncbi:MAG TPA: hypothetical protein VMU93_04135 [Caulobacteraceae bacterium]|nr:hypothetical protein [Caulobacteraceae bacterium]